VTAARWMSPAELDAMLPENRPRPLVEPTYEPVPAEPEWLAETAIGRRPEAGIAPVTFDAFLREPDPGYAELVTGLGIPDVGVTVLAGPPKSLKTMLAGQLSLCLSSGIPFLGSTIERGRGARVLFVEEEGNRHRLRERFRRQADGLGADYPTIELLLFAGLRLDNQAWVAKLGAKLKATTYALVVLDPFSFLHGADENKPSAMAPIMRTLNRLAQDNGTSIVAIHHVTKPQADRPQGRLGDRIRGASSITAGVDALFVLDRSGDKRARLQSDARDAESVDIHLELDVETLLLSPVGAPPRVGKIDPVDLLAWVTEHGQVTAREAMVRFNVSKTTALQALSEIPGVDSYEGARNTRFFKVTA
jgi:AAA domain-containing protein